MPEPSGLIFVIIIFVLVNRPEIQLASGRSAVNYEVQMGLLVFSGLDGA